LADPHSPFSADLLPAGSRIACRIEYDGRHYSGWQSQPQLAITTVQESLEHALSAVANAPVKVACAGRTDTGVHGFAQIIHFDAPAARSTKAWVLGVNANLPFDIRVHWAVVVPVDFHARFSALARRYRYVIANTPVRPAQLVGQITWQRRVLDHRTMHSAAQHLLGEQDFSAFRAASCRSKTPMRNVHSASVSRRGDLLVVEIEANAFLHHMVRNIAGSLMAVGVGREPPQWIGQLLEGRDRTVAAETAPADGLYLVEVEYPTQFALPATPYGPLLLGLPARN
jgi:tRNA pseudouridine38-40 synthase